MKLIIIFMLIFYARANVEFLAIESCWSSNITLSFEVCEITNNRVNAAVLFWTTVTELYLKVKLYKEVNGDFREIFKFPSFEWCSVMDGTAKTASVIRTFLNSFKERYPKAIRPCPLSGTSEMMNVTLDNKLTMMFPSGRYRFTVKSYSDNDPHGVFFSILGRNDGN